MHRWKVLIGDRNEVRWQRQTEKFSSEVTYSGDCHTSVTHDEKTCEFCETLYMTCMVFRYRPIRYGSHMQSPLKPLSIFKKFASMPSFCTKNTKNNTQAFRYGPLSYTRLSAAHIKLIVCIRHAVDIFYNTRRRLNSTEGCIGLIYNRSRARCVNRCSPRRSPLYILYSASSEQ